MNTTFRTPLLHTLVRVHRGLCGCAHSISRFSNRGRIIGLRRVAISTVLCAQNCNSRSTSCETCTTSSRSCAPSMPPVSCCKALDKNFTLKLAGFYHMNWPTTAAISGLVVFPFSNKSLHPSAKTCAFSSGTQISNVTVSNPKPRKNAHVVKGTSLRFISKINTFFEFF